MRRDAQRQIEDGAYGNHRAVGKAQGLLVLDVQFLVRQVGRTPALHLAEDEAHVEERLLEPPARHHQDHGHDSADEGRNEEDSEPALPPDQRPDGGHQLDVARAHCPQRVECRIEPECDRQPDQREHDPGLGRTDQRIHGEAKHDAADR